MAIFAGQVVTADFLNNLDKSTTYTPALTASTNPDLGTDGTAVGKYHRGGHLISLWARFRFDSDGSAGSGTYEISVDIDIDTSLLASSNNPRNADHVGAGLVIDGDGNRYPVSVFVASATVLRMEGSPGAIDSTVMATIDSNTFIGIHAIYPADASAL